MAESDALVEAFRPVAAVLDRLGVRYCVGGSLASTFHGAARSTLDVDVSAELDETSALRLIEALHENYYGSESAARDAVRRRSCFNLIQLATSYKIDIFVSRGREFDRRVLERAVVDVLGGQPPLAARIASAEDIILIKLEWYRLGDEVSERQWHDVVVVARLQGERLDRNYLNHWAKELGVEDLMDRLYSVL